MLTANIYNDRRASVIFSYVINMPAKQSIARDCVAAANKRTNITKILYPYHLQSLHLQNHSQIHHHPYSQSFHLPDHHLLLLQSCQVWSSKTAQCSDAACVLYPERKINIIFRIQLSKHFKHSAISD
jgi:hypothetical protein